MTVKIKKDYKKLHNLQKELPKLNKKVVQYGYFDGDMHKPSVERGEDITLASLMGLHELGDDMPKRDVFTQTGYQLRNTLPTSVKKLFVSYLSGLISEEQLLKGVGDVMKESTQDNFGVDNTVGLIKNSDRTIEKKGRNDPLVDDGYLRDAMKIRVNNA